MKPLKAWCLKDRHGNLWPVSTLEYSRRDSIRDRFKQGEWRKFYRKGWRCVRVEIKEVEK